MSGNKEFYVDSVSEELSEDQIRTLHAWCVEVGVEDESVELWIEEQKEFPYFGLDYHNETMSKGRLGGKLCIKFSEVRNHIGLPPLEEDITEQLSNVASKEPQQFKVPENVMGVGDTKSSPEDIQANFRGPTAPCGVSSLVGDAIVSITTYKDSYVVCTSGNEDEYTAKSYNDLLELVDLLEKLAKFGVVG